jgi:hypothetical protein
VAPRFPVLCFFIAGCYQSHGLFGGPCTRTEDCPESPVGCAQAWCGDGVCELIPIPDSCAADETCDFVRGCVGPDAGRDAPGLDAPPPDAGPRPDVVVLDVPVPFDVTFDTPPFDVPFDGPIGRPDVPRLDAPRFDAPFDSPRVDAPIDAPRFDVPVDSPRFDVPIDAPLFGDVPAPTSLARQCRPDSVMTMLDHPLFSEVETTLELWVRARGPGMIARKGEGARRHYDLSLATSSTGELVLRAAWGTEAADRVVEVPFASHVGRWTHVALVHRLDATGVVTLELYVDARQVASAPIPGTISDAFNTQAFLFCTFDGDLDEIRFWGGALDAALLDARRFGSIAADTPGLQAYWPLDVRGQVIFDRTLHGADGVAGTVSTPDPADPASILDGPF